MTREDITNVIIEVANNFTGTNRVERIKAVKDACTNEHARLSLVGAIAIVDAIDILLGNGNPVPVTSPGKCSEDMFVVTYILREWDGHMVNCHDTFDTHERAMACARRVIGEERVLKSSVRVSKVVAEAKCDWNI